MISPNPNIQSPPRESGAERPVETGAATNAIVKGDISEVVPLLPNGFVDLLILDPPYNLTKTFASIAFRKRSLAEYAAWLENLLIRLLPKLKNTASVYVCSEWHSSTAVHLVLDKLLKVRNRITWEREKGRGARANWKNASEDIWFATVSDDYIFNIDAVKLKRKVRSELFNQLCSGEEWMPCGDSNELLRSSNISINEHRTKLRLIFDPDEEHLYFHWDSGINVSPEFLDIYTSVIEVLNYEVDMSDTGDGDFGISDTGNVIYMLGVYPKFDTLSSLSVDTFNSIAEDVYETCQRLFPAIWVVESGYNIEHMIRLVCADEHEVGHA